MKSIKTNICRAGVRPREENQLRDEDERAEAAVLADESSPDPSLLDGPGRPLCYRLHLSAGGHPLQAEWSNLIGPDIVL